MLAAILIVPVSKRGGVSAAAGKKRLPKKRASPDKIETATNMNPSIDNSRVQGRVARSALLM